MEYTVENHAMVVKRLLEFSYMPGFPDTIEKLESYAKAFMRVLRYLPIRCFPNEEALDDALEAKDGYGTKYLPYLGKLPAGVVTDLDWILLRIADNCERFPMPITVNKMYIPWRAANAKSVNAAQNAMAGEE